MDLYQSKLSRAEWETIEKPVSDAEKKILQLIIDGYHNPDIKTNDSQTFLSYTKIENSPEIHYFIFKKYFADLMQTALNRYGKGTKLVNINEMSFMSGQSLKSLKSGDSIRINNSEKYIKDNKNDIFEYLLIDLYTELLKNIYKKRQKYAFYLYTLIQIKKTSIQNINNYVLQYVDAVIDFANKFTVPSEIITNAYSFIEQNKYLIKYSDNELYPHQKKLFRICNPEKSQNSKLILYTAPTGTGKTLSPIGLSENNRIIFVCVARHIGLALAKAAISKEKKVAFAFGCETASDIRLHYFSAVDYIVNKRSGGIGKVDNSVGTNVEIMICDVQSYITAMHYMLSFNAEKDIITYWDEPTITLDYNTHDLHDTIHNNWKNNKISKVILSCATLPTKEELLPVCEYFKRKFDNAEIHYITSHDCKKSIPILDKEANCVLPHYLYKDYNDLLRCVNHCQNNKTLLRYFDLREIVRFIDYVHDEEVYNDNVNIDDYFENIADITMNSLKEYYLELLCNLEEDKWEAIYRYILSSRKQRFDSDTIHRTSSLNDYKKAAGGGELKRVNSVFDTNNVKRINTPSQKSSGGVLATTKDAYTFTDGPTIYLTDDIDKVGQFYIQQSKIEPSVFQNILSKIDTNATIIKKIESLEAQIKNKETKIDNDNKEVSARESGRLSKESNAWTEEIQKLTKSIRLVSLDAMYMPNTTPHQNIWAPNGEIVSNAFVADVGEENAKEIMHLNVENNYKVLMLLGIGTFKLHKNARYMEIMKKLADEQKLFMIIASTDYIYGTNYQFCHGFIGKDLANTTVQKKLQAMGRIGRNNIQQDYTIRFRDNDMINELFSVSENNIEAINMQKLFTSVE